MRKLISIFFVFCFVSNICIAQTCDWKTGITPGPASADGAKQFLYSESCHQAVGALLEQNKNFTQANNNLNQAIQLKDLALTQSDQRTQLWMTSTQNEQDRLEKMSHDSRLEMYLAFGLGILVTVAAGYTVSKLEGH